MSTPLKPAEATSTEIPVGRNRLEGKVILVFGAGSVGEGWGNGKATSVAYAKEGATVIAVDREKSAAEATASIIDALGGRARSLAADVTDSASVKAVVDEVVRSEGQIDVLHNNVGTTIMGGPVELSEEDWHTVLDVNLTSAYLTCKHVLPGMIARGKGAIINISSIAAIRYTGYPYSAYYAAKAGVNQFTIGLALQYARQGIRVNAIMPGLMNTPLIYQQISGQYSDAEAMARARHEATPMGRMGTGWDIAAAAVFLASDEANYITGVCLPVDGGLTCKAA
jgi:NAD(P)-dependent dehydrogenase (short-subunit alcohol dehydrogenase family)